MAAAYFGRENPVGRRLTMGEAAAIRSVEVIGVVRDSIYHRLQDEPRRVAYVPYMQAPDVLKRDNLYAEVRTAGGGSIGQALQAAIRGLDATAPIRMRRFGVASTNRSCRSGCSRPSPRSSAAYRCSSLAVHSAA